MASLILAILSASSLFASLILANLLASNLLASSIFFNFSNFADRNFKISISFHFSNLAAINMSFIHCGFANLILLISGSTTNVNVSSIEVFIFLAATLTLISSMSPLVSLLIINFL